MRWNYLSFLKLQWYNLWKKLFIKKMNIDGDIINSFNRIFVIICLEYILCLTKITTMAEMKKKLSLYFGFQIPLLYHGMCCGNTSVFHNKEFN